MAKLTLKKTTDLGDLSPGWKKVTISGAIRELNNNGCFNCKEKC